MFFQDNGQIIIDFSSMHINEMYAVQSVVNAEIKLCEHNLAMKVTEGQSLQGKNQQKPNMVNFALMANV